MLGCYEKFELQLKLILLPLLGPTAPLDSLPFSLFSLSLPLFVNFRSGLSLSRSLQRALLCNYSPPTPTMLITSPPTPHSAVIAPDHHHSPLSLPFLSIFSLFITRPNCFLPYPLLFITSWLS